MPLKYWLVFSCNTGNREDSNVYYSKLVKCETKKEAIETVHGKGVRIFDDEDNEEYDDQFDAIKLKLHKPK